VSGGPQKHGRRRHLTRSVPEDSEGRVR
jgi:hypothetical protein